MKATIVKLITFATVCVLVLVVLANTMLNRTDGSSRAYEADFTSVSGLRVGDDVRVAGVRVGRVDGIGLVDGDTARVRLSIGEGQRLTDTTGMVIRYQNLLGQRYLALLPGRERGTFLASGSVVPSSRTSPGFDLTALLNGFEPLFETLQPEDVNRLADSVVKVLQGEGGTVESLLDETATLTRNLADKDAVVTDVLTHLTPVLENLVENEDDLTATVDELRALMTGLAEQRSTIGESIDGISELSRVTADLVEDTRPDVVRVTAALRTTAALFAENLGELQTMLAAVPTATGAFARPMSYGSWLNMYICNLGVEVGGQLVNVGSPDGPYSEVCR